MTLRFTTDRSDPAKDVSSGTHYNSDDTPEYFPFNPTEQNAVEHVKGADSATIRSDINTYLGTQSRTEYDPTQAYDPAKCSDELILKDSTDGSTAWRIKISNTGVVSTEDVTE